jgi:hypothetical protein
VTRILRWFIGVSMKPSLMMRRLFKVVEVKILAHSQTRQRGVGTID